MAADLHLKLCTLFACATSEITKIFVSSPARAEGFDTPAQQLEHDNSTTFMTVAYLPLSLLRHTMRISAYKMHIYEYFENAYL